MLHALINNHSGLYEPMMVDKALPCKFIHGSFGRSIVYRESESEYGVSVYSRMIKILTLPLWKRYIKINLVAGNRLTTPSVQCLWQVKNYFSG
jgi:hypothetical protein